MKPSASSRILNICRILVLFLCVIALFLYFGMQWLFHTFPNLELAAVIYEITVILHGAGPERALTYLQAAMLPALILSVLAALLLYVSRRRHARTVLAGLAACSLALSAFSGVTLWNRLKISGYLIANNPENRTFIEDSYTDPGTVRITFPQEKRNLILVYLESMETTFASAEYGGAFPENLIPELTEISLQNENFSGGSGELNGAKALYGSTWTVGSMFSSSSGLPLKTSLQDHNAMDTQPKFFDTITTMGDILEENGYYNTLLIGSDAVFGGRKLYYTTHGNYEILDLCYMQENHRLPSDDYHVWWGYEDMYLYRFARETLTELSREDEPFNLTMLAVDTHFEDGYVCDLCEEEFGDDQYANVYRCASRQFASFLDWCRAQPWYENTTIVVTGDHETMDSDFCSNVPQQYERREYTAYINSAAVNQMPDRYRLYSTFDTFPTVIAALGAEIEGERLGLGTNLFSGEETLTERYGIREENRKLMAESAFMTRLADIRDPQEE